MQRKLWGRVAWEESREWSEGCGCVLWGQSWLIGCQPPWCEWKAQWSGEEHETGAVKAWMRYPRPLGGPLLRAEEVRGLEEPLGAQPAQTMGPRCHPVRTECWRVLAQNRTSGKARDALQKARSWAGWWDKAPTVMYGFGLGAKSPPIGWQALLLAPCTKITPGSARDVEDPVARGHWPTSLVTKS